MSKKYYVYLALCRDNTLYCGYTVNLKDRIATHNSGLGAKYTRAKSRRPIKLMYFEIFSHKSDALKREYAIKQLPRKQKDRLIEK